MDATKTSLERAFELAQGGRYISISEIRGQLKREGYEPDQLSGRVLSKQLKDIILSAAAKTKSAKGERGLRGAPDNPE